MPREMQLPMLISYPRDWISAINAFASTGSVRRPRRVPVVTPSLSFWRKIGLQLAQTFTVP